MGNSLLVLIPAALFISSFVILKKKGPVMKNHEKQQKREEIRVQGTNQIDIPLEFKPVEVSAAFLTVGANLSLPTCSPVLGDSVTAEIVSYAAGRYWAIRVRWKVSGTRDIEVHARNYAI
jgi:hypothetical protein